MSLEEKKWQDYLMRWPVNKYTIAHERKNDSKKDYVQFSALFEPTN